MSGSNPPIWRFQAKRSPPPSISCPGEIAHHSEASASPKASRCPLAEVYSLAKVRSTAQLSQGIKIHPEIQGTRCGSPCDPNWEALPRVSRLSGCVISGINTAVFVSPHSAPDRAAARPPCAAGASHLGTDAIRALTELLPGVPGRRVQAELPGGHKGTGGTIPGGESSPKKPPSLFPSEWGWSLSAGQPRAGRSPCARTLRRSEASPRAFQVVKRGSREGE